jgi:hypothetical protein
MSNPEYYEDEFPVEPAVTVLKAAGMAVVGLTLAVAAAAGILLYSSARAGQRAHVRLGEALAEVGREFQNAADPRTETARAVRGSTSGLGERQGALPAV